MSKTSKSLAQALGVGVPHRIVCFVGAGGKTTAMFNLAGELQASGLKVITSATTKIFPPTHIQSPAVRLIQQGSDITNLQEEIDHFGHITVGNSIQGGKLIGIDKTTAHILSGASNHVLIEADGAKGHCVKAPEEWEPVIPDQANLVVGVIGLDCLGKKASEDTVFRFKRFQEVTGIRYGEIITIDHLQTLILSNQGLFKSVAYSCNTAVILNKLDLVKRHLDWSDLADRLFRETSRPIERVILASAKLGLVHGTYAAKGST